MQRVFTYSQELMVSLSSAGFKFTSLMLVAHLKMIEWFYSRASLSTSKNERKEYQQIKLAYMVQKNDHWYLCIIWENLSEQKRNLRMILFLFKYSNTVIWVHMIPSYGNDLVKSFECNIKLSFRISQWFSRFEIILSKNYKKSF